MSTGICQLEFHILKQRRCDIETWPIDRVLQKENFHEKYAEYVHQKLVADHY